ncbi:putative tyrosinase-like protein tyr-1 [Ylistrum balloti]|uniref:putative tyrosinase-like protein tyr-1 n=1 Tax=Ylistrum balloti TaxID=509963 RepID=UPI0029058F6A|nr:putative tyrosinase-like protein tyr-1 [Ylistrum balloti]
MAFIRMTVVALLALVPIIYASELTQTDEHPLDDKTVPSSKVSLGNVISKILQVRDTLQKHAKQEKTPLRRMTDPYAGSGCCDNNELCDYWARVGECDVNPEYMHINCQYSCNLCCIDYSSECVPWANSGQCFINPDYMLKNCQSSCGVCSNNCVGWKRDVTRNLGLWLPRTKDSSHEQLSLDKNLKRALDFGKLFKKEAWLHTKENDGAPGTRPAASK